MTLKIIVKAEIVQEFGQKVLFIGIETKCSIYIPEFCFNKNWLINVSLSSYYYAVFWT